MKKLSLKGEGTIAVDLDGTLAEYTEWKGIEHFGKPIPKMIDRVKKWIAEGRTVVIFTARAEDSKAEKYIKEWLEQQGLGGLKITNIKTKDIVAFYDDRAVHVEHNTGEILGKDLEP